MYPRKVKHNDLLLFSFACFIYKKGNNAMSIIIRCMLPESSKNFESFSKIYDKLEELANTNHNNILYKIIFKDFSNKFSAYDIKNLFNTTNKEAIDNPTVNFWIRDDIFNDICEEINQYAYEPITVKFYIDNQKYCTYSEHIEDQLDTVLDSRLEKIKYSINDVVNTLEKIGFININIKEYDKSDLSFLVYDKPRIKETINNLIEIVTNTPAPKFDLKYEININVTSVADTANNNINANANFEYFMKNYFDFFEMMNKLIKSNTNYIQSYNDYDFDKDEYNNLKSFVNFKYKDLQNIFYKHKSINEVFTLHAHKNCLASTLHVFSYIKEEDKNSSITDNNRCIIKNINVSLRNLAYLKTFIEFYTNFQTLITQFNEKYNNNNISVSLKCYLNGNIVNLSSNSIEENCEMLLTKIKEQIEKSLEHLIV